MNFELTEAGKSIFSGGFSKMMTFEHGDIQLHPANSKIGVQFSYPPNKKYFKKMRFDEFLQLTRTSNRIKAQSNKLLRFLMI